MLKTKIIVSPFFFAVLTMFLLIDQSGIAFEVILFSFLHETGHFLALLCVKSMPKLIEISVFGIRMELPSNLSTAKKCAVLMAGFAVNFILATMLFICEKDVSACINLIIGIFTAIPLAATDGGIMLKVIFEEYFPQKAEKCLKNISFIFLSAVSFLILFAIYFTGNYFLFIPLFYMILCAIKDAA